jgi:alkylated DNA nucleotide flippase Atl1
VAKETVEDILRGYNGTILAYGQTGSGKSYSMFGKEKSSEAAQLGIIPRAIRFLFEQINQSDQIIEVTVKCSFLEIYRENIRDLLQPARVGLRLRETPSHEVFVENISEEYVGSWEDIAALLATGEKSRTVASTLMNSVSSRSHSVLIITVNQKGKDGINRIGKLSLVDLAGSERQERTGAVGVALEEAKQINQSLSALGNVISALTDNKRTHVPYRDSCLTYLLSDSLGGNSKTTLLICCSDEYEDLGETLSTLQFGKRAKMIKNIVRENKMLSVEECMKIIDQLKKTIELKEKEIMALHNVIKSMKGEAIEGSTLDKQLIKELLEVNIPSPSSASSLLSPRLVAPSSSSSGMIHSTESKADEPSALSASPNPYSNEKGLIDGSDSGEEQMLKDHNSSVEQQPTVSLSPSSPSVPPSSPSPAAASSSDDSSAMLASAFSLLSAEQSLSLQRQKELEEAQKELTALKEKEEARLKEIEKMKEEAQALEEREREREEREREREKGESAVVQSLRRELSERKEAIERMEKERNDLLTANDALKHQLLDMKNTWSAYIDLIIDNQKQQTEKQMQSDLLLPDSTQLLSSSLPSTVKSKIIKPFKPDKQKSRLSNVFSSGTNRTGMDVILIDHQSTTVIKPKEQIPASPAVHSSDSSSSALLPTSSSSPSPSSPSQLDTILKRGYLYKKPIGFSLNKGWKKRLFLLRPQQLDFYNIKDTLTAPASSSSSSAVSSPPSSSSIQLIGTYRGSIPIDSSTTIQLKEYSDAIWAFELKGPTVKARLNALSEMDRNEWIEAISKCIARMQNVRLSVGGWGGSAENGNNPLTRANEMLRGALEQAEQREEANAFSSPSSSASAGGRPRSMSRSAQSSPLFAPDKSVPPLSSQSSLPALDLASPINNSSVNTGSSTIQE